MQTSAGSPRGTAPLHLLAVSCSINKQLLGTLLCSEHWPVNLFIAAKFKLFLDLGLSEGSFIHRCFLNLQSGKCFIAQNNAKCFPGIVLNAIYTNMGKYLIFITTL